MSACPRCGHTTLAHDGINTEAGGVLVSQTWVAGCLRCSWTPADGFDDERQTPPFLDDSDITPRKNKE